MPLFYKFEIMACLALFNNYLHQSGNSASNANPKSPYPLRGRSSGSRGSGKQESGSRGSAKESGSRGAAKQDSGSSNPNTHTEEGMNSQDGATNGVNPTSRFVFYKLEGNDSWHSHAKG